MTNKEKLEQMFEMQKELDLRIIGSYDNYPLYQQEIALFVELGELMNELPTIFKHWKKSAVDNREKALEELVDCWHFAMSLQIHSYLDMGYAIEIAIKRFHDHLLAYSSKYHTHYTLGIKKALKNMNSDVREIVHLTYLLGFTFEEVYEGYLKKNEINHKRQDENY